MKDLILTSLIWMLLVLRSENSHAVKMRSACYLVNQADQKITGVNPDQSYEIASVSKLFTSYFALSKLGSDYRFSTLIYIKRAGDQTFDIHFAGNRDPYAGREMMQFIVSELNRLGIENIRNLTFDENFKFIVDVRANSTAHSFFRAFDPTPDRVTRNLQIFFDSPQRFYSSLREAADKDFDIKLPERLKVKVSKISFLPKRDFSEQEYERPFIYQSVPLVAILKEMNRNSNNHSANQIFEFLGGASAFDEFYYQKFPHHAEVVKFYNGSGNRVYTQENKKLYNMASCRSVIEMMVELESELRRFGYDLSDIMPVAGQDIEGEISTVTPSYNSETTRGAMIGKTGTVDPSVTLAGKIFTYSGDVYFNYIYGTNGTDWSEARRRIRGQVIQLIQEYGGPKSLNYKPRRFLPFDSASWLKSVDNLYLLTKN